ncbi:Redox-sensitive transcriptional activator SoxR [Candidatus Rhodobacter oscarellae]|uniref:Redox-sensitive transcriptional activator SoxR n=1 Tax=Candidatus Rhodobacter oscarellae TaxID=1675527 RepID=A0A0J9GSD4_9RHOB|nr:redox-sensitive transcriptional activator SoxR [Candidatus Rhodobacter lobularis]KMW56403.1 Redox-sensitive transcriptional activator SoxR [Candidatus Rhodobacter lobularis]
MKKAVPNDLSVGEMAARAGVAVSTLHYYEAEGLIESWRTPANHRRYDRRELRRVAIIRIAQTLGIPLAQVRPVLDKIPRGRTVKAAEWAAASEVWAEELDDRIEMLLRLRQTLGHCIGCGCLSVDNCPLYNAGDAMGDNGPGPRRWTGAAEERADPP